MIVELLRKNDDDDDEDGENGVAPRLSSQAPVHTPNFPSLRGGFKTWGTTVMKKGRRADDSPPVVICSSTMIGEIRPFYDPVFSAKFFLKIFHMQLVS